MELLSRRRSAADRWRLEPGTRLAGGFRSEVFACTTSGGEETVLKLTATIEEAGREAAALRIWAGTGVAVHLLDADLELGALLLERIRPATPLPPGDDRTAVVVAAEMLRLLHGAPLASSPFPSLEETYLEGERGSREDAEYEQRASGDPTRGLAGLERLDAARALAMRLCATTDHPVLLHGDFLDKNLLWNGARYVAIDPIPRIGDPCADIGAFAAEHPPASGILERAGAVATRMGLDAQRARQWAAVWTVQLTASAWRQDQAELEACLGSDEFEQLLRP